MINEEIAHIKGIPQKLVIFLHGYIDSSPALDKKLSLLYDQLDNFALHLPQAPIICEIHENKRQWYSMHRFDPNDDRKLVATMEECVAFYDRMALGLQESYNYLMPYIENLVQEYNLDYKDVYLCGFSQGAMVALYISLMCPEKIGACISLSGILAGSKHVMKYHKNQPYTLLVHGTADNLIRFEALDFTKKCLEQIGCPVNTEVIENGQHIITEKSLISVIEFIKKHSK